MSEKQQVEEGLRRPLKVIEQFSAIYEKSPPHLKATVGFTLRRNLEKFKVAGGKFS